MVLLMTLSLSEACKYSSLNIYTGDEPASWPKSRKTASSIFHLALKVTEGFIIGYTLGMLIKKLAIDFKYTENLLSNFPKIEHFVHSPNFLSYCGIAIAASMIVACMAATIVDYNKKISQDTHGKTDEKDLASSIQKGSFYTSPIMITLALTFSSLQSMKKAISSWEIFNPSARGNVKSEGNSNNTSTEKPASNTEQKNAESTGNSNNSPSIPSSKVSTGEGVKAVDTAANNQKDNGGQGRAT